jgi:hypothetical protein
MGMIIAIFALALIVDWIADSLPAAKPLPIPIGIVGVVGSAGR